MQLSSLFTATALLAASAVDARISGLGVPATIKPGDVFSVSGHQVLSQPRQHTMVWGIVSASVGIYPGSIGTTLIGKTDIDSGLLGGGYNITIDNLKVPEGFVAGPAAIQAAILQFNGVVNQPSVETWAWNVTIGDETSEEVVFVDISNNTFGRRCSVDA